MLPQPVRGEARALRQRLELEPGRLGVASRPAHEGAEAAVGAADHVLPAGDPGERLQPLRHQPRMLDVIGQGIDDAGDQRLAVGNADAFPHLPFMGVARIGGLEIDEAGIGLEHGIDDVLELDVVVVRAGIVAPAQVQPHLLRRQAARGLVHRLDRHRHVGLDVGGADIAGEAMGAHGQIGRVELQIEAGRHDRLVFDRQRRGRRLEIGLVRGIVEVGEVEQHLSRRDRRDERVIRRRAAERGLEIVDVALHGVGVAQLDRPFHIRHHQVPATLVFDEQLVDDLGKLAEIGGDELGAIGEAGIALHHVIAEADLAHLAVRDDVDAGIALLADDLLDRFAHPRAQLALVHRLLVEQIPHHAGKIRRPRQAAGVGGEDTVGASFHRYLPHSRRDAMSAPWRTDLSFAQTTSSATHSRPANVPKPQSVPAMTRSRSPTAATASSIRRATTSGCSTKLVVVSITPGMRIISGGSLNDLSAAYSCWWRGLANSMLSAPTLALLSVGNRLANAMSWVCGPSQLPQQQCSRTCAGGMPSMPTLIASTSCSQMATNSFSDLSWKMMWRSIARSGASICRMKPPAWIARYSLRISLASAST